TADDDAGAELHQTVDVAAGDAAVGNVADQGDGQALDTALELADGEDVEQALRRVFVGAVAGIDDAAIEVLRQQMRRAGHRMEDHGDVDAKGLDVLGRVDERLALADAGAGGREVDEIGAEEAGGSPEANARARRRLEEKRDDDLALKVDVLDG